MQSVICFGAGRDGRGFISIVKNRVEIEYFLDNGLSGQIENYKIYKPSVENCRGKFIVVTASLYYQSIKEQLESYGLYELADFISAADFLMLNGELMNKDWERDKFRLHLFLRNRKAVHCALMQLGQFIKKEELVYEMYPDAVILPFMEYPDSSKVLFGKGGVVDKFGKYVQLSSMEDRINGKYRYENPQYRDERVVYCGYFFKHWGHFLIEEITRLWYFLSYDNLSDKYVFIINRGTDVVLDGNYKEFFRLLGILDRIEIINEPVQYREVIVPQMSYSKMRFFSDHYKGIFSRVVRNAMCECKNQKFYDKVYFSRSHWGRAEFGLDMLDDFFNKNGFKVFYPETITLAQMIFIIQKADTVAAVSGSAAHNILFGKDGQELIIIEKCAINNMHQTNINRIKQLDVIYRCESGIFSGFLWRRTVYALL